MPKKTDRADIRPRSATSLLTEFDEELREGHAELASLATGFDPLDAVLGGGLRPGELTLIGGMPGVGKTVLTLQWARNLARNGATVYYVCYEHDENDLLVRLLSLEMGEIQDVDTDHTEKIRTRLREAAVRGGNGLLEVLSDDSVARSAYTRLTGYADRLHLMKGSGRYTGVPQLEEIVAESSGNGRTVLFVDYLQKVSLDRDMPDESEKVTVVTEGLKDLALERKVPVVSVVAADRQGLKSPRLRLHDLRGSSALQFEADVALILNNKYESVAKVHRAYDPVRANSFKEWSVFSVEKNRGGPADVNLEFKTDFPHFRYEPVGGVLQETLYDDRTEVE